MSKKINKEEATSREKVEKAAPENKIKDQECKTDDGSVATDEMTEEVSEVTIPLQELDALNAQLAELQDKYLRLSAEFDNYRKRTLKEKSDLIKSGGESVLLKVLPVMDDFERGLAHLDEAVDMNAMKEGVLLIYNKFKDFFTQSGLKEIETRELDFDIDRHEAITRFPAPSEELKGKIVDVVQKGYTLNDKVVRYAKVVVGE